MGSSGDIIGLDIGEKRIGVARTSPIAKLPEALEIVSNGPNTFERIKQIANEHSATMLIVGLPHNMSGQATAQTKVCQQFAADLRQFLGNSYQVKEVDESLSTTKARQRYPHKKHIDDHAAAIILEHYLEEHVS